MGPLSLSSDKHAGGRVASHDSKTAENWELTPPTLVWLSVQQVPHDSADRPISCSSISPQNILRMQRGSDQRAVSMPILQSTNNKKIEDQVNELIREFEQL
jgi:hypothetical protein